ncbi:MAG: queuine tRNA-ribosyltransferase [Candidatus Nomurabacteria bacterium GW2011_GWE1_35_16]|uniref:Queuine tRNA-ribosyltransferase n=1 Tax=Candidatus Nomurabacteria bacterium GW2011_GWE1_35_16 TaxID=1618761 RepID=A0A0G0DTK4_9BACT|nr:MAG: queuine tRNA-ribosyltransferase [Candidatus Nomurabacteria bacterium GW2011_GWE1_35_16]
MKAIDFKIEKKLEGFLGRAGTLTTPHGVIETPSFVVVGTKGTVKAMTPEQLKEIGVQVTLANTYHLYLQPGSDLVREAGGLHKFMNWQFSLGVAYGKELSKVVSVTDPSLLIPERSTAEDGVPRLATIGNDGVSFRSHLDGSLHYITPEKSIEIQHNLGADIIFAFDECTSPTESERYQDEALSRTHSWAKRSLEEHKKREEAKQEYANSSRFTLEGPYADKNFHIPISPWPQALFGIVQGGRSEELRKKSAKVIGEMDFDGFGIGGSFAKEDMSTAVKWVNEVLPEDKPRHLLGIGEPEDLFSGVENGVDLFDCVAPTRIARNGTMFTKNGKINILNAKFVKDFNPIDEGCKCNTCTNYTRAYLSHLFRAKEMLGATLASIHNVYFITNLVKQMRDAILNDTFQDFKNEFLKNYDRQSI